MARSLLDPGRPAYASGLSGTERTCKVAARILVVDDDPGLRLALSDRFESEGYKTETASDGGKIVVTGTPQEVIVSRHPALREFVETSGLVAPEEGGQA